MKSDISVFYQWFAFHSYFTNIPALLIILDLAQMWSLLMYWIIIIITVKIPSFAGPDFVFILSVAAGGCAVAAIVLGIVVGVCHSKRSRAGKICHIE